MAAASACSSANMVGLNSIFWRATAGLYHLELCYAAAESRPLRLKLNGTVIKERAAAEVTGNWFPEGQRQFPERDVTLRAGKNTLRLETDGAFPHLSQMVLTRAKGEVNVTGKPAPPADPWLADDNLGTAPRPMEEIAYDQFDLFDPSPSRNEMARWFTPIENGHIDMRDYYGGRIPTIEGKVRLNAPLSEDSVLRLSLYESQWLALHFWRGEKGLTLRTYENKGSLVAYATSGSDRNRPIRVLAATDDERNWRTNPPLWPMRLDIRFHKGLMVVSRGDLELLRAPSMLYHRTWSLRGTLWSAELPWSARRASCLTSRRHGPSSPISNALPILSGTARYPRACR